MTMTTVPETVACEPFDGPLRALWGGGLAPEALESSLAHATARLGIPDLRDRAFWNAADSATITAIRAAADVERGTPWPQPLLSQFAAFFRDGNRTRYEDAVRARAERLTRAVVMAAVTGATRWVDEAADGVLLACEQSGWSWAAHDDVFSAHSEVVPREASPYLDLGAGELAAQLAWADHLLGPAFDERVPGLRARVRHEVRRRVFEPFLTRRDWHWLGLDGHVHNWSPWIQGNVITAAVLLEGDPAQRAELVARALDGIDRYVATLPPDGAPDEGFAYWWNGACRAIEALEFTRRATGGALDAAGVPALVATVSFPHRMHLGGDWYVNVADGSARLRGGEPWHAPFAWARRVGDADAARHALAQRTTAGPVAAVAGGLGRLLHALADPEWVAGKPAGPPLVARSWLPSIEVLVARERAGEAGLALAVKGGHNGENHNHLDLGSVIVASGGVPLVVDAGKTTYTARTFGPRRYELPAMRSEWHSAPAPRGLEQGVGATFRAEVLAVDEAGVALDLTGAYALAPGESWRRVAQLDRAFARITVADEWRLEAGEACVHYLLRAAPERVAETALRLSADGESVLIEWDRQEASVALDDWELDDAELCAVWGARLTRLTLTLPDPAGHLTVTIGGER
ncbi:heparinase II/III family protein [Gryllotalpicola protaetiae]|uniref:Heparinase n=1 Tax=Gryllotalpicola protaetiae TaxID=2419771 RepID=A0A387BMN7_9MICO|nr:heparinase II/III family protein [Gryllotalpicola protaetiae]AYG02290.1 hypothetical protein D7I44_01250 [Gryllotalpicola protaetiae]